MQQGRPMQGAPAKKRRVAKEKLPLALLKNKIFSQWVKPLQTNVETISWNTLWVNCCMWNVLASICDVCVQLQQYFSCICMCLHVIERDMYSSTVSNSGLPVCCQWCVWLRRVALPLPPPPVWRVKHWKQRRAQTAAPAAPKTPWNHQLHWKLPSLPRSKTPCPLPCLSPRDPAPAQHRPHSALRPGPPRCRNTRPQVTEFPFDHWLD